jgi:hypothetical protein
LVIELFSVMLTVVLKVELVIVRFRSETRLLAVWFSAASVEFDDVMLREFDDGSVT